MYIMHVAENNVLYMSSQGLMFDKILQIININMQNQFMAHQSTPPQSSFVCIISPTVMQELLLTLDFMFQGAIYGMAQSIPDRSMVTEVSQGFLDCLYSTEVPKIKNKQHKNHKNHMNGNSVVH